MESEDVKPYKNEEIGKNHFDFTRFLSSMVEGLASLCWWLGISNYISSFDIDTIKHLVLLYEIIQILFWPLVGTKAWMMRSELIEF